jgi:hypothetical protein
MSSQGPAIGVLEFLSNRRFHQSFILPPSPEIGRGKPHRFSYSDFGDSSSNAVVLFCGALMGARLCYSPLDKLAKAYNVRIIHVDRPGIGGTDPIELEKRVQIWLGQNASRSLYERMVTNTHRNGAAAARPSRYTLCFTCKSQWRQHLPPQHSTSIPASAAPSQTLRLSVRSMGSPNPFQGRPLASDFTASRFAHREICFSHEVGE